MVARRALEVRAAKAAEGLEGDALSEAIGAEVGVSGDRLARLVELVDVAGDKLGNVRLVRVFQGETAPPHAMSVGEFHYVLDRMAAPPRAERGDRGDRRGGREGGPRRDRPGGGPGGGGRGGPGGGGRGRDGFGADRGERVNPREVPVAGAGWMMTRAPRDPDEDRRGPRRGPRRDRPPGERRDRGPGGDRRGPRRGPGGPPRAPQGAAGPGAPQAAAGPGAPVHLGPKAEVQVGGDAPGGDPRRRRRRGGRRRGGGAGGPRPEGTTPPPHEQPGSSAEAAPPPIVPPPPPEPEPASEPAPAPEPEGIKESEG
ncbi:MAG TPA: hypothetical protein VFU21_24365 [Kofleriaceae bacterium]|nr:hypothetical protein [Kofleriaceae bacterium]